MNTKRICCAIFMPFAAALLAPLCASAGARLDVRPVHSEGIPGELHKIELSVEMDLPSDVVLRIPPGSNVMLRAVEKYPVVRSASGTYVQRRLAVFQGLEAGSTVFTNILAEIVGEIHRFPPVTIRIKEVQKALPPGAGQLRIEEKPE